MAEEPTPFDAADEFNDLPDFASDETAVSCVWPSPDGAVQHGA